MSQQNKQNDQHKNSQIKLSTPMILFIVCVLVIILIIIAISAYIHIKRMSYAAHAMAHGHTGEALAFMAPDILEATGAVVGALEK